MVRDLRNLLRILLIIAMVFEVFVLSDNYGCLKTEQKNLIFNKQPIYSVHADGTL